MMHSVVFLLGAGASVSYGVPMMRGFYIAFRSFIERRYPHCLQLIEIFEQARAHAEHDLETLLSDLHHVLEVDAGLDLLRADKGFVAPQVALAREVKGHLDAFIVETCERFDLERAVAEFRSLLELRRFGPLWLFTTNYDRILETACEQHGIAWADGFESTGYQPVADWSGRFDADVRIAKLHGSVNWYKPESGSSKHRLDRGYALPTHEFRLTRAGQSLRQLMIIPTLEKDALADPYVHLALQFTDVLQQTRLLVIAGSSLRDRHIRGYIQARLPRIHVLLVSPSATRHTAAFGSPGRTHALDAGFSEFLTLGASAFAQLVDWLHKGDSPDEAETVQAISHFVELASSDTSDEAAVQAHPALASLWQAARDDSVASRARAVVSLANFPHPAVLRRVRDLVARDPAPPVRVAAIAALTRLAGDEAISDLEKVLYDDVAQEVQVEAALALIQTEGSLPALQRALGRPTLAAAARAVIEEQVQRGAS